MRRKQQSQRIHTVHNVRALGLERYETVTHGVLVLAMAIIGRARWPLRPSLEPGRLPRSALAELRMLRTFGASGA